MTSLAKLLSPISVKLDDLLLDPNNPRFSELGEELNVILESRFVEKKIQDNTFEKMKSDSFNVSELKDTIKSVGFLPMDRIVVSKWKGSNDGNMKYVVIEGNRRVSALKWLMALHDSGKETFDQEQQDNFSNIDCLIIDDKIAPDSAYLILPGLRHVSGIKEWGPYQKAKTVHALRKSGMSSQQAAQSLGLSTRAANNSYRCFIALEQMKNDEEFGEFAIPKMYSYFEEIFKRAEVKNWLGWREDESQFTGHDNLHDFYSWMIHNDETDDPPKLPEAKSVREFALFVNDPEALATFKTSSGTLSKALARYEADHPEEWYPRILAALGAVKSLTPEMLRSMEQSYIDTMLQLKSRIETALQDRNLLMNVK